MELTMILILRYSAFKNRVNLARLISEVDATSKFPQNSRQYNWSYNVVDPMMHQLQKFLNTQSSLIFSSHQLFARRLSSHAFFINIAVFWPTLRCCLMKVKLSEKWPYPICDKRVLKMLFGMCTIILHNIFSTFSDNRVSK